MPHIYELSSYFKHYENNRVHQWISFKTPDRLFLLQFSGSLRLFVLTPPKSNATTHRAYRKNNTRVQQSKRCQFVLYSKLKYFVNIQLIRFCSSLLEVQISSHNISTMSSYFSQPDLTVSVPLKIRVCDTVSQLFTNCNTSIILLWQLSNKIITHQLTSFRHIG